MSHYSEVRKAKSLMKACSEEIKRLGGKIDGVALMQLYDSRYNSSHLDFEDAYYRSLSQFDDATVSMYDIFGIKLKQKSDLGTITGEKYLRSVCDMSDYGYAYNIRGYRDTQHTIGEQDGSGYTSEQLWKLKVICSSFIAAMTQLKRDRSSFNAKVKK